MTARQEQQAGAMSPGDGLKRALIATLALLTAWFVVTGLGVMLWLSPKVPYADTWRFLTTLSTLPFPDNVLHADNGHRQVLPNLVQLAELQWLDANQWLQVLTGAALALASFSVVARALRESRADSAHYWAMLCSVALSIFWLGNQRTLAHGNESLHAYLITLCLAMGLQVLGRNTLKSTLGAAALAMLATLSFGTGIATFAAFAAVLWLQRAGWRLWLVLAIGALLSGWLLLAGNSGGSTLQWAPAVQAPLLLRWLAAPFLHLAWPAFHADAAAQVPTVLGPMLVQPFAQRWENLFGATDTATWPWLGIGVAGVLWFLRLLIRARTQSECPRVVIIALGMAAFGLTAGGVIVAARTDYFTIAYPGQLMAARYLVWSSLFWGGLLLATVGVSTRRARAAGIVALIAVLTLPSQMWAAQLALRTRGVAEQVALGGAVGVLGAEQELGETVPEEMERALPHLRERRASMYAWPETQVLDRLLAADTFEIVAADDWQVVAVDNRFGAPGMQVKFVASSGADHLLLLDSDGRARGMAMPDRQQRGPHWSGWVRGRVSAKALRAVRIRTL